MKINNLRTLFIVSAAAAVLSSCKIEHPTYYNAYMTALNNGGESSSFCTLITDDSITVYPLNQYTFFSQLKTNDRVYATFTIPSGEITDPMEVEFNSVTMLTPLDIVATSSSDTLNADDPANPETIWQSGGIKGVSRFLNIVYTVNVSQYSPFHGIYLVDDLNQESNPDPSGYYHLQFMHNANNDPGTLRSTSVATFPLTEKYTAPGIKGIKVRFSPIDLGVDSTLTLTF